MSSLSVRAHIERWPIAGSFTISRGSKTEAVVVVAEVSDGTFTGRGEAVPYARYGESPEKVVAQIEAWVKPGFDTLHSAFPAGAARNALDCAFWDLKAKQEKKPIYKLLGLEAPKPLIANYTISLGTPDEMAEAASRVADRPVLKVKLGKEGDPERVAAVRRAAPQARLIVDANEGWLPETLTENLEACKSCGVELVEQPLPAANDEALSTVPHVMPICADESVFDLASLSGLAGKYDAVNIKLDKTGGLTEALAMVERAKNMGLGVMVGCMVCTSLSIAPAFLVAQQALFVDLDGPLLLAKDRAGGLRYAEGLIYPPSASLWG
jgi:L-alanine-DL-glutamate epimerase-like enolase superfamily enzyme